jgi:uncharacterized damage-inducible protein DinB
VSALAACFSGWEQHNQLLERAISGLDADQLSLRPAEHLWSIRMLASHVVAVRAWWFNGWMGEGGPELAALVDFDEGPEAETRRAEEIVSALGASWAALAGCLGRWTDADLGARFQRPRPNREGERPWRTRQYIVWHVAEHDVHHGGEISITLGMHGLPGLDL